MNKKIKNLHIALFIPSLSGGGAERVFVTLANNFADMGFRVDLILTKKKGAYLNEVSSLVKIINLNTSRVVLSTIPLYKYLSRQRPEVLLSTLPAANAVAMVVSAMLGGKVPLIVREASMASISLTQTKNKNKNRIISLFYNVFKSQIKKLIAGSVCVAKDAISYYNINSSRVVTINNPVITKRLYELSDLTPKHKWFDDEKNQIILGVGRLVEVKNFKLLIDAFAVVSVYNKRAKLIILGEGPERKKLEMQICELGLGDKVDLLGFVNNPFGYMAKASVYVLSSNYEGLPATLIQAMACGSAVISTDCPGGSREILQEGKLGVLVAVGDIDAMAIAMAEALNTKQKKIQECQLDCYKEEKSTDEYVDIIRKVVFNEKPHRCD
jgi:glycosyltransferase involved in cell wall biosynthesis